MLIYAGVQSQALIENSARPARDARILAHALVDAALRPGATNADCSAGGDE
jgi:hypothetical protein